MTVYKAPEGYLYVSTLYGNHVHLIRKDAPSRLFAYAPALCGNRAKANGWMGSDAMNDTSGKVCSKCAASYQNRTGKTLDAPINVPSPKSPKSPKGTPRKNTPVREIPEGGWKLGDVVKIGKFGTIVTLVKTFGTQGTEFVGRQENGTERYYHVLQFEKLISRPETVETPSPEPTGEEVPPSVPTETENPSPETGEEVDSLPFPDLTSEPVTVGEFIRLQDLEPEARKIRNSLPESLRNEISYWFEVYRDSGYKDPYIVLLIMSLEDILDFSSERIEDGDFEDNHPNRLRSWVDHCKRFLPVLRNLRDGK